MARGSPPPAPRVVEVGSGYSSALLLDTVDGWLPGTEVTFVEPFPALLESLLRPEDGERVTIVEFESAEAQRAWSLHPEHVEAKKKGRASFYTEYRVQICTVERDSGVVPSTNS